jgi:colanic acid biosynthesis protein WcaH
MLIERMAQLPLGDLTAKLKDSIGNPREGLPKEAFLLVSQLTPLINVDLLVRNDQGETLLTWREDEYYGPGWHVPGGIVRFKERFAARIQAVAKDELGAQVQADNTPLVMNEVMAAHRDVRGHFISLLYRCQLLGAPAKHLEYAHGAPNNGEWKWHKGCPDNLLPAHEMYRKYIDGQT